MACAGGKVSRAGSGRSFAKIALSVRMRCERGAVVLNNVVQLFDQGGGFIVRQVKEHDLDMGSLSTG
jgi:hypothetical protein